MALYGTKRYLKILPTEHICQTKYITCIETEVLQIFCNCYGFNRMVLVRVPYICTCIYCIMECFLNKWIS